LSHCFYQLCLGLFCQVFFLATAWAFQVAQPESKNAREAPPEQAPPPRLVESQPAVYFLPDKNGLLVPVLDFPLEQFQRLTDLAKGLPATPPKPLYHLQRLTITGSAAETHALLSVAIRVITDTEAWVGVGLALPEAKWRKPPEYKGGGEVRLEYDAKRSGWVAWLRGKVGAEHEIALEAVAGLTKVGDESRLKLTIPVATVSELSLEVPLDKASGQMAGAGTLESASSQRGATQFRAVGFSGDFELIWTPGENRLPKRPLVLEAMGTILSRIDGQIITTDARLEVQGFAGPFDRFLVRLPAGAELIPRDRQGYTLVPVAENATNDPQVGALGRLVEVRLDKASADPVTVELLTQQTHGGASGNVPVDLAGFSVTGAVRQHGRIAVRVDGDWQVVWGPRQNVLQAENLPQEIIGEGFAGAFDYLSQPWSLGVRVVPLESRISVEPLYVVLVDDQEERLEARLRYTIRGAKVFSLALDVPDLAPPWEIDEIGPANMVDHAGIAYGEQSLSVPLLQGTSGELELTLRARRRRTEDTRMVDFALPVPRRVNTLGQAQLVVVPADDVELTPRVDMAELVRQQDIPAVAIPERQQEPLVYLGDATTARFVADLRRHSQKVAVEVDSLVTIGGDGGHVEQRFDYQISYQSIDHLTIRAPASAAQSNQLDVRVDGQVVTPSTASAPVVGESTVQLVVPLSRPRIGSFEAILRYPFRARPSRRETVGLVTVPLAMPAEGDVNSNAVVVSADEGILVKAIDESWTPSVIRGAPLTQHRSLSLSRGGRAGELRLAVQVQQPEATRVERAWIQSWLGDRGRQDRAVFRLTSTQDALRVALPTGALRDEAQVIVDGRRVRALAAESAAVLEIPLVGATASNTHVIELRYRIPRSNGMWGRYALVAPRFDDGVWVQRTCWQLLLPRNQHVLWGPPGFDAEYAWRWQNWGWRRRAVMDTSDLESWSGATQHETVPTSTNAYLYSSLSRTDDMQLRTVSRAILVLSASGAALLAGLSVIYVPRVRRASVLWVAAVVLFAVALLWPELAILVTQAAMSGLVLAVVAGWFERYVARRGRRIVSAGSSVHRASSATKLRLPVAGLTAASETAPLPLSISAGDSKE